MGIFDSLSDKGTDEEGKAQQSRKMCDE